MNKGTKTPAINKNDRFVNLTIDTLRVLSCEMIAEAKSGHPGIALGAAPILYTLFKNHLVADPTKSFLNRDRFVMSAGHGSALLYAVMHLSGYDISLNDLKNFRKINSKTAGHPENILIDGVDISTGPLGQGVGAAVGMAIAETKMNQYFKKYNLVNYYTYCLLGDGCFQEGVSFEALSIAAKYKLNKLIFLYDSNDVQLEGRVADSTVIDTKKYFESIGLNYIKVANGNDYNEINEAILLAKKSEEKPTIIEIKTKIGFGSVHEDSPKSHGAPLSEEEIDLLKNKLNYHNEKFEISKNAYFDFESFKKRGTKARESFEEKVKKLKAADPTKYKVLENILNKEISFDKKAFSDYQKTKDSTRNLSNYVLSKIAEINPLLTLLSPDISSSTKINFAKGGVYSTDNRLGMNLNLGVREFAMGTIINGICSTGLKAIGSTFLPFSDYCKAAIRLSSVSKNPGVFVFSHDSIAVGEDGPTHQAVEQLWGLRLIPNHYLIRPCNLDETIKAFEIALTNTESTFSIITSRQEFDLPNGAASKVSRGAYAIKSDRQAIVNILATGSEVALAFQVESILSSKYNIKANIISVPCVELFLKQIESYEKAVLGTTLDASRTVSIEFGSSLPWSRYAGIRIGVNKFGLSGTFESVCKKMKLTAEDIAEKINNSLPKLKKGETLVNN
ncbi:transketolase [Malacoplasma penetrans]|uniref:Transketolase n=1 Tax=Malacoplasma penetrans (strain HF-2) TaxID=272633 RepID=Q8EWX3_MALP2|nr:transketolase [Malacoplasma penetrans]RXY97345.1 transketolase [Malacoplasma penetrans]BAC43867.1 transketolase [Malacoplasma penetrans HF-2]